jgi:hypothetical protein
MCHSAYNLDYNHHHHHLGAFDHGHLGGYGDLAYGHAGYGDLAYGHAGYSHADLGHLGGYGDLAYGHHAGHLGAAHFDHIGHYAHLDNHIGHHAAHFDHHFDHHHHHHLHAAPIAAYGGCY